MDKKIYTEKQKLEIEKVLEIFQPYLLESPNVEIVWLEKVGCYLLFHIDLTAKYGGIDESFFERITSGKMLFANLLDELAYDVVNTTGQGHAIYEADAEEREEIKKRVAPYAEKFPAYQSLVERMFDPPKYLP